MSSNQTDLQHLNPTYKLFFDDIEEIFLHKISFRFLNLMVIIAFLFIIGIFLLLFYRPKQIFLSSLIPFYYTLIIYDFFLLLSILLLKYNFTEKFFNQLCQWTYYLKSLSESGQCLTLVFFFGLMRHQIRYFSTHNHLPNSSRINSRALTFVCLLFIIYINNWITHLKIEKNHLITLNENKYEIHIQELSLSLYDIPDGKSHSYFRFIEDLEKYSLGNRQNQTKSTTTTTTEQNFQNQRDGHEIIIRVPFPNIFNPISNRTKRNTYLDERNHSYRINRCTYGQGNYFLANFLSLIHLILYLILLTYYLVLIQTFKYEHFTIDNQEKLYEKARVSGRKKSAERHQQCILLLNLKEFFSLILYSHTFLIYLRLIYQCVLILLLYLLPTPFKWLPLKTFFYILFCLSYFSIPFRMAIIFVYIFRNYFSVYLHSLHIYLFHTNLRFSWKFQKPTVCFRFRFIPYQTTALIQDENLMNSLVIDISSSMDEDQSHAIPHESVIVYDENSTCHPTVRTSIHSSAAFFPLDLPSNTSAHAKL